MSELEKVLNKIFDLQEERFREMLAEAKLSFGDCAEKYNQELDGGDDE